MISKNVNLEDVIKRDLFNKFSDFIGNIKKKINNDLTEEDKKKNIETNNLSYFIISNG